MSSQEDLNNTIQRTLGRIEGKLDSIDGRLTAHDGEARGLIGRIVSLEKKQWYFTGAMGFVTIGIVTYIRNLINGNM